MKVVRIIARLNVGGPARHVAWLTAELPRVGYDSVLVAGTVPPGEEDMSYFAAAQGVRPVIIPEMSREISVKDALTVWKLYRLLLRERPDVVHTHTAKAGTVGRAAGLLYRWLTPSALLARPRRCRFVHTYHGHVFRGYYGRLKTRLFLAIEKILARAATDRIVVISAQQLREIHHEFGVGSRAQFAVVPLGLDVEAFDVWEARRGAARAGLGVGDDCLAVGIVGRLTEIKNHRLFLEAAARYQDESSGRASPAREKVRFVIVGDGHLRPSLEGHARALGLGGEIIFTGSRRDPENFYAALDVVALTSLNEGTPLTLIEAMASARPVVATTVGGVVDLIGAPVVAPGADSEVSEEGYQIRERGVGVRSGDVGAFARGLARLIDDAELRREMGERGRAFVRSHYSKERLVADIKKLYDDLLLPQPAAADARRGRGHASGRIVKTASLSKEEWMHKNKTNRRNVCKALLAYGGLTLGRLTAQGQTQTQTPTQMPTDPALQDQRITDVIKRGATMEEIARLRDPVASSPKEALHALKTGNARFFSGTARRPELSAAERRAQILGQTPFAVVLGCSDSRVPTEIIFDQSLGSLFITRVAGNIVDTATTGSIEYAVQHLKTYLVVVMGHEGCGAVKAALLPAADRARETPSIQALLNQIAPSVSKISKIRDEKAKMREAVIANVRQQVSNIKQQPAIQAAMASNRIVVVGAFYEITSGAVDFFETDEELRIAQTAGDSCQWRSHLV